MRLVNRTFLFLFILMWPLDSSAQNSSTTTELVSSAATIISFTVDRSIGAIDETTHKISVTVPSDIDITTLIPIIEIPKNATVDPASGIMKDFTTPITYTVTAQDGKTRQSYTVAVTKLPKKEKNRGGIYLKFGLAHWQGDIFSQDLTRWQGNIFGSDYNLTSLNTEFEFYFAKNHILSGWSIGYRKDDMEYTDAGHMFSGKTFRNFDLRLFEIKTSGGMEWGIPSLNFDKTVFGDGKDGSVKYRHTYPKKNSNIPGIGTTKDGVFYPFGELSILERRSIILIEGGMRINIIKFGVDNYQIINDQIKHDFGNRLMMAPYLFLNIGIKIS